MKKEDIVLEILNHPTDAKLECDYNKLREWKLQPTFGNVGNLIVDYFTLEERLNTRMKSKLSFYEFLENIDAWKSNASIERFYNEKPNNSHVKRARNAYKIYFGNPTIFKPLVFIRLINELPPIKHGLLDPTMGWGGRAVGASIVNIPKYIGIDSNQNLLNPYNNLVKYLGERSNTKYELYFQDALTINYNELLYDGILTSYPYYNIEKYSYYNQCKTKAEMNTQFYKPLTNRIYEGLQRGGYMALNVSPEIYKYIQTFMGDCHIQLPLVARNRNATYKEFVYVWVKGA